LKVLNVDKALDFSLKNDPRIPTKVIHKNYEILWSKQWWNGERAIKIGVY
jgi:hypothetical protein